MMPRKRLHMELISDTGSSNAPLDDTRQQSPRDCAPPSDDILLRCIPSGRGDRAKSMAATPLLSTLAGLVHVLLCQECGSGTRSLELIEGSKPPEIRGAT